MTAPTIPGPIPFEWVRELCEKMGLEPGELESLEFTAFGMYVTFFATNEDGHKMTDGRDVALHRIYMPYLQEEATS